MAELIVIVETGVANTASVRAALGRSGCESVVSGDPERVAEAAYVVLPGVGAFGVGMTSLEASGLVEPLRDRARLDRPLLAVCLGLQLLCERSEEAPGVAGLGVLNVDAQRFDGGVRVPQFGWNRVVPAGAFGAFDSGYAYFANSYRLTEAPDGWACAWADHGGPFIAAVERGRALACQFHPELSGAWGQALLTRWLRAGREAASC